MSSPGERPGAYRALLLDLDGTLVDGSDRLRPENVRAVRRLEARGVRVMVATGRSELSTAPVLDELALTEPAVVFNGAAIWCPRARTFLEERTLSDVARDRAVRFGRERGALVVTMCAGAKYALRPSSEVSRLALREMHGLEWVDEGHLAAQRAIRVTLLSDAFDDSGALGRALERAVARPVFVTHFPLRLLPQHRDSPLLVCDVHPPCRGKAEGLRWLWEQHGIAPREVVAVGDGPNDVEMLEAAGLGVAMEGATPEALAACDRVIGSCDGDAIARLLAELWP